MKKVIIIIQFFNYANGDAVLEKCTKQTFLVQLCPIIGDEFDKVSLPVVDQLAWNSKTSKPPHWFFYRIFRKKWAGKKQF